MTLESKHLLIAATAVVLSAAGLARAQTTVPGHLPRKGLVAFWTGDGHPKDSAGKHHGTIQGNVKYTAGRNGKANGAFLFDGKSAFVKIPDSAALDTDKAFTLAAWINPTAYEDKNRHRGWIISKYLASGPTGHADYSFCLSTGGQPNLVVCQDMRTGKIDGITAPGVIPKNKWTHVAASFDRGRLKIYVNGKLLAEKVSTRVTQTDPREYTADDVRIGSKWDGKYSFTGAMDEVGIWNRALSDVEIAAIAGPMAGLPQVTRKADADRVALKDGKILLGTIKNRKYTVSAFFGKIEVPAKDVVGLVQADKKIPHPRLILTDGQVVAGKLAAKTVQLVLPGADSPLQVPVGSIREFGYRISKEKPADPVSPGAMVALSYGDRLAWTEMKHKLQLVTSYATVDLPTGGIRTIELGGKTVRRRVQLANGSTLTGTLLPDRLKLKLKLGPVAEVHNVQLVRLFGPAKPVALAGGATMVMRNGDRLLGRILDKTLTLKSALGAVKIRTTSIFKIEFDATRADTVTVKTWGGGVMKAQLVEPVVTFAIVPNGPTVKVNSRQIVSITRSVASPPPEMLKKIEKLIAQLGAESYVDREKAQKELIAMGKNIAGLLKKYLAETRDPEIRQRLGEIIKALGG